VVINETLKDGVAPDLANGPISALLVRYRLLIDGFEAHHRTQQGSGACAFFGSRSGNHEGPSNGNCPRVAASVRRATRDAILACCYRRLVRPTVLAITSDSVGT